MNTNDSTTGFPTSDGTSSAPGGPAATTAPTPARRFVDWLRGLGLTRPADDRVLGGVASGIARKLGLAPWIIRLALILLVVCAGVSVWFYIAAWVLLPDARTGNVPVERFLS